MEPRPKRSYKRKDFRPLTQTEFWLLDAIDEQVAGIDILREDCKQHLRLSDVEDAREALLLARERLVPLIKAIKAAIDGI